MTYSAAVGDQDFTIDVVDANRVVVDGHSHDVDLRTIDGQHLYSLILDNVSYELFVERRKGVYYVMLGGDRYPVDVEDERLKRLRAMGGRSSANVGAAIVTAPMPGLVARLLVAPGDEVEEHQGLLILEAMKMENEIRSPQSGVVKSINVTDGQTVNPGDPLAVVEQRD